MSKNNRRRTFFLQTKEKQLKKKLLDKTKDLPENTNKLIRKYFTP